MDNKEEKGLSDILRKVVSTGMSAAFMTEEAVKSLINDLPLPKETINGLLQNAKLTRDEFITSVKNELKSYLNKVDVSDEIHKVLEDFDIEVKANISFKKKKKTALKK